MSPSPRLVLVAALLTVACTEAPAGQGNPPEDASAKDVPVAQTDAPDETDVGSPALDVAADRPVASDRIEADSPVAPVDVPVAPVDVPVAPEDVPVTAVDVPTPPIDAPGADVAPVADAAAPDVTPAVDAGTDAGVAPDAPSPADGGTTPATGFAPTGSNWVVPNIGLSDGPYVANSAANVRWWSLIDLDGDGRADLVQTGDPTRTGGYVFGAGTAAPSWRFFRNTGTGFATTAAAWSVPNVGLSDGPYTANSAANVRWWSTFDIDGDGRPDLVQTGDPTRTGGYVFGAGTSAPSWRVFLNTGTGFAATATTWAVPSIGLSDGPYTANSADNVRWWSTIDMNADGRPDFVQTGDPTRTGGYVFGAGTSAPSWRVFLNTGTGFATTATTWAVPNIGLSDGPYATAVAANVRWWSTFDIDGDRRPDFVQTGDPTRTGGYVFGAGTAAPSWRVFANTGTGFAATATPWATPNIGLSDGPYVANIAGNVRWWSTLDVTGDRRPDLVQTGDPTRTGGYVFGAGTASPSWRVFANTGTGFAATATPWATPNIGLSDGPYTTAIAENVRWWTTLDLNGDGRVDLAQTGDPTRTGGYVFPGTPQTWRVFLGR